jgi:hypothetical protein
MFDYLLFSESVVPHFRFNHSYLSLPVLQSAGIRSTKWLEESLEDSTGRIIEITVPSDQFRVFVSFGFCIEMIPILFVFELDHRSDAEVTIISRQARKMVREEIGKFYCGN